MPRPFACALAILAVACAPEGGLPDPKSLIVLKQEFPTNAEGAVLPCPALANNATHLFCISNNGLLAIQKSEDGYHPTLVGELTLETEAPTSIAVDGDLVVAGYRGGLNFIDVSNPAAPTLIGNFGEDFTYTDVVLQGTTLFALAGRFLTYDVSDPANPVQLARYELSPELRVGLTMGHKDSIFYFSVSGLGLTFIDASDPSAPVEVGHASDDRNDVLNVAMTRIDNTIYGASGLPLRTIDMTDPSAPTVSNDEAFPTILNATMGTYGTFLVMGGSGQEGVEGGVSFFATPDPTPEPYFSLGVPFVKMVVEDRFAYLGSSAGLIVLGGDPTP